MHRIGESTVISFYQRFRFRANRIYTRRLRGMEVSIWNASDALASGIDPAIAHAGGPIEDASND